MQTYFFTCVCVCAFVTVYMQFWRLSVFPWMEVNMWKIDLNTVLIWRRIECFTWKIGFSYISHDIFFPTLSILSNLICLRNCSTNIPIHRFFVSKLSGGKKKSVSSFDTMQHSFTVSLLLQQSQFDECKFNVDECNSAGKLNCFAHKITLKCHHLWWWERGARVNDLLKPWMYLIE